MKIRMCISSTLKNILSLHKALSLDTIVNLLSNVCDLFLSTLMILHSILSLKLGVTIPRSFAGTPKFDTTSYF